MITFLKSLSLSIPISLVIISILFSLSNSITFSIQNNCPFTVWPAAVPGGGRRLDRGQTWSLTVPAGSGRIWGRTNCNFDESGRGQCQTGDCKGVLECQGFGTPPSTMAEYSLRIENQIYFDISLVDGFNVPIEFTPISGTNTGDCQGLRCSGDITGRCPDELRAPRGCNNPCTVFQTDPYCCTSGRENCRSTNYSRFFKSRCRDAYTYPWDSDETAMFFCPVGANYSVVFCPYD